MKKIPASVLFFVYGTLKKGHGNDYHLEGTGVEYLGTHTTEPKYTMESRGGYPAVYCEGKTAIKGELYRVTNPHVIQSVYGLEGYSGTPNKDGGNNGFYDVEFIQTPHGEASMFVFRRKLTSTEHVIPSGVWGGRVRAY